MTARRVLLWCLVMVAVATAAAVLLARQAWLEWQQAQGIERLEWQGLNPRLSQLQLDSLLLEQQQGSVTRKARLEKVAIHWDWRWPLPQLTTVQVDRLELSMHQDAARENVEPALAQAVPSLPQEAPAWLPQRLGIAQFEAELPCATGRCVLNGSALLARPEGLLPLDLELTLDRDSHRLDLVAKLKREAPHGLQLDATLALDDQSYLTLATTYQAAPEDSSVSWSGDLDMPTLPTEDWVMQWLAQWQPLPDLVLPPSSSEARLSGHWRLQARDASQLLQPDTGQVQLQFQLPQPWPVPGVASVQGRLATTLTARDGQWAPRSLDADLTLHQLADWVLAVPEPLRPQQLTITARPLEPAAEAGTGLLPLQLTVKAQGPTPMTLESALSVATEPPWRATLEGSRLQASHQRLTPDNVILSQLAADLKFRGRLSQTGLEAEFGEGSQLRVGGIDSADGQAGFSADTATLALAGQSLVVAYDQGAGEVTHAELAGPVSLRLHQLHHPVLKSQAWQARGQLALGLERLATTLRLSAVSGFATDLSLSYPFGESLVLDAHSDLAATTFAEQMSGLLSNWPESVTLEAGQVTVDVSLQQGPDRPRAVSGHVQLEGLTGIWDRVAFMGLGGNLNSRLEAGRFTVGADDLTLTEINPGVPVGPVDLAWFYQADAGEPLAGRLELDKAEAGFLGGQAKVLPGQWQLAQMPLTVPVELERLDLTRLMELYPTEGLSGTGTLSGRVPVLISDEGLWVERGQVTALDPGGVLKLPAERIPGIGQGNQAMELIGEALKNFHYTVLKSTVDYDQDGTLHLDLRIEGRNPEVKDGYPVVLNIDLEEDLPALLTSLQLSGRVNEAVTERVRELVRQRDALNN